MNDEKLKPAQIACIVLFVILLAERTSLLLLGLNNELSDLHGFRQAQTAITAYFFTKDGFRFDYITPILGYPWVVPFEFPLYQGFAAWMQKTLNLPLNVAGRLISILSFYASLLLAYFILKRYALSVTSRLLMISVILLNPVLLFWSRTFMIESTVVFFSLSFVFSLISACKAYSNNGIIAYAWIVLGFLSGSIAAAMKITTFSIYFVLAGLVLLGTLYETRKRYSLLHIAKFTLILGTACFVLPTALALKWTAYTDILKADGYLSSFLVSGSVRTWSSGDLAQKLSWPGWQTMNDQSCGYLFAVIALSIAALLCRLRYRFFIISVAVSALVGPAVFTNLYTIHDYYCYANMPLLSAAIGFFTLSLWESRTNKYAFFSGCVAISIIFWSSQNSYYERYYHPQITNHTFLSEIGNEIQSVTSADDVLLVLGADWSSEIPYYSKRKAVCVPIWITPELESDTENFLDKIADSKVTSFLTLRPALRDSVTVKILRRYGLNETPLNIHSGSALLYLKIK